MSKRIDSRKDVSQRAQGECVLRKIGQLVLDLLLIVCITYLALVLRYETTWNLEFTVTFSHLWGFLLIYAAALWFGGIYETLWRYAGVHEVIRLAVVCLLAGVGTILLKYIAHWSVSRTVLCLMAFLSVAVIGGTRMLWRVITTQKMRNTRDMRQTVRTAPRLMIVGAGIAGAYVLGMCKQDPGLGTPILFVDDNPHKQGLRIQGIQVLGKTESIPVLAAQHRIQDIIVAIPGLKGDALTRILGICRETACRIRISSKIQGTEDVSKPEAVFVRDLNISDFLSREEIKLDAKGIADYLTDQTVLITGGGGSIGSELCRQVMRYSPKKLVVFDIYENTAYELLCELKQLYGQDCPMEILIGSVQDRARLTEVFSQVQPRIVFHAAAHKHVPLMEDSPAEAVKNNVFGTLNTLEAASAAGVERFVLLSTDKAVNPTNVMGATKRITEMVIQHYATKSPMRCMAVRFGNVLGSHGSVIPLFERQIKAGGPVTVTHPDIIRFFMTIPEAAQLVLQAGAMAKSGSVYVLDMGQPVRIYDLAEQLIRFYGYEPNVNMDIKITGLRPGEKLFEELLTPEERMEMQRTDHDRIMIAPPVLQETDLFDAQLQVLRVAACHNDSRVTEAIQAIVPGFTHAQRQPEPSPAAPYAPVNLAG